MRYEPPHRLQVPVYKGRRWKWLSGAGVAAMLWSGMLYAWVSLEPHRPTTIAYNAPSFAQTLSAPIQATQSNQIVAAQNGSTALTALESHAEAVTRPHLTHAHRAAVLAPRQTAGVIPVSATTEDTDALIVRGERGSAWVRTPSAWSLADAYPQRALERGREGEASVHCTVRNSGALNCVRTSETPAYAGFGEAALRVTRLFRHTQQRADGSTAAGSTVDLRIVFRMTDNDHRG